MSDAPMKEISKNLVTKSILALGAAGLCLFSSCTVNVDDNDPNGAIRTTTSDYNPITGTTTTTQRTTTY